MSRRPLDEIRLNKVETALSDRPVAQARQFEEWADEPQPEDCLTVAELHLRAAERWISAERGEDALRAVRRAVDDGGYTPVDVRCYLIDCLLVVGQRDEADAVAADLRRSKLDDLDVYIFVGDSYEIHGDPREAHRWFTMGVTRSERTIGSRSIVTELLGARHRVRRTLELPADALDLEYRSIFLDEIEAEGYDIDELLAAAQAESAARTDPFRRTP